MHVVATAGHVDHGKSTLVRALTGMEPDRWAEERRRGLTLDLGFAWTTLPSGDQIAFVDVPGHERFINNMLAGVGPAPAVMFVVAADEGWSAQSDEHLHALAALDVGHLLLVVTKTDLAAPTAVVADALRRIAAAGLPAPEHVAVSAATGAGLAELRGKLDTLCRALPSPDTEAPVRLWVDRAFTIRGAGTVVSGTLTSGSITEDDEFVLMPSRRTVAVRALQSHGAQRHCVEAVARVALNLRGVDVGEVARGMALTTPDAWTSVTEVDALVAGEDLPAQVMVHIGAAATPARMRRLGGDAIRLRICEQLPLHLGDRLLLRDPASRRLAAAEVADLHPQPLRRRGDAERIGRALRVPTTPDEQIARRGVCTASELRAAGLQRAPQAAVAVGEFWIGLGHWTALRAQLHDRVAGLAELSAGVALHELRRALELPDVRIVRALAAEDPDVVVADGRVRAAKSRVADVPGLAPLLRRLDSDPLAAPDAGELAALGLGRAELAAAVRAGRLLRLTEGVYVAAAAPAHAATELQPLAGAPFSVSAAREVLGSSRRVVVPLLEHLDAARVTRKLPDGTRLLVGRPA